ncbi:AmmeMemoRadiSam system protein A [Effusibacillus dendaii]|uniref:AMMECR1 domain-containing protein n=1 Tax=Effusibacillus dendaii TaxID=2743772 RepID=A0A7I8DCA2_9BACL|nr:AmmeMemoRadiSam system protein A [Effusibacillus dendaii]BCJ86599.1 hypothetical protein skT53_15840 [Effusibacillus dendaii]
MMGLLMPHAAVVLPEVGGEDAAQVRVSYDAMLRIAREASELQPDIVVVVSPHGPVFADAFAVWGGQRIAGNLSEFGASQIHVDCRLDQEVRELLLMRCTDRRINAFELEESTAREYGLARELDYGVVVPFYFLQKSGLEAPVLHIAVSGLSRFEHYRLGMAIGDVLTDLGRRAVVIASGDCSHRLTDDAPAGYHTDGARFDKLLRHWVETSNVAEILFADEELVANAAEDVLRPLSVLFGCFDRCQISLRIISYEGPFGVGYLTASFIGVSGSTRYPDIVAFRDQLVQKRRMKEHRYVKLAREALEIFVREGRVMDPPDDLVNRENRKAIFVSIKKDGELRGCIGSLEPTENSLPEAIIRYAIEAGTEDPRFFPVEQEELSSLLYTVDVLGQPEPVTSFQQLDPARYGIIVSDGCEKGVLLPGIPGIDSVQEQFAVAREKAGIEPDREVKISRFTVERFY